MNPTSGTGDLNITIGGDLTPLESTLAAVPEAFAGLTTQIEDAFAGVNVALNSTSEDIATLATAAGEAIAPVTALGEQLDLFASAPLATLPDAGEQLSLFATYAGEAASETAGLGAAAAGATPNIGQLGNAASSADGELAKLITNIGGGIITFQALKAAIVDTTTAYADIQKATIALGAILGDQAAAQAAIDSAKQLADALGIAQDQAINAQQKLAALGIPLSQIPSDLTAIADGAAAMNTDFDTAAQRFDQIVNSGALMQRSLTSIGLNVNDVAAAMGMAGVPATVLTTAFKNLDEVQRSAVLSSAELAKNANVAAQAASGVAGTWNQVKNALESALQDMGRAVDGFSGLATAAVDAIKIIETTFNGLVAAVKVVVDAVIAIFQTLIAPVQLIGQVIYDAFTGRMKDIPADVAAANGAIEDALKSGLSNIQKDYSDTSDVITKTWGGTMDAVSTSTKAGTAQAGEALNVLQSAAQKAATDFAAVSAAFNAGKISAEDYTKSLTALNKAQMDANGGLEQLGTAILIAANNFRQSTVDLVNANTTLNAIKDAIAVGASNWTAYDEALKKLDADQKAFNNGLADAHTTFLLVSEDFQNMGVAAANAQTNFTQVVAAMQTGAANATQYTAALEALNKAQIALNGGFQDFHTALLLVQNAFQQAQVAATNAETVLQATRAAYDANTASLDQLISATDDYVKAQLAANGGVQTWQTANAQLAASQAQLTLALQNANTVLAQAQEAYANGSISLGVLQKAQEAAKSAQDALNGTTATAAAHTRDATSAQNDYVSSSRNLGNVAGQVAGYWENINGAMQAVVMTYQQVHNSVIVGTADLTSIQGAADQVATTFQNLNGTTIVSSTDLTQMGAAVDQVTTSLQNLNGTAIVSSNAMSQMASGLQQVGQAAKQAASDVMSLGQGLDATMNAQIGNLNVSLTPGQTYTQPTGLKTGGTMGDMSSIFMTPYAATSGETPFGALTNTYDPLANFNQNVMQAANAAHGATTAFNATNKSAEAMTAALQQVADANALEQQAALAAGTDAYDALKQVADAAAQAAAAALASANGQTQTAIALSAMGTAANNSASTISNASTSIATASNSLATGIMGATAAATVFGGVVNAVTTGIATAVIGGVGGSLGSTASVNVPSFQNAMAGPGGTANPIPASTSVNLNLNMQGSVLTGANGMQQLTQQISASMVNALSRIGIRLTRG